MKKIEELIVRSYSVSPEEFKTGLKFDERETIINTGKVGDELVIVTREEILTKRDETKHGPFD